MDKNYPLLDEAAIERMITENRESMPVSGQRVLVIVPDLTRTMPLSFFFRLIVQHLRPRVHALDFLVALGTHPPLDENALNRLFGVTPHERVSSYGDIRLINHAWKTPEALVSLGAIPAHEDRASEPRPAADQCSSLHQSAGLGVRPPARLRTHIPTRGGRLLWREQIPFPRNLGT